MNDDYLWDKSGAPDPEIEELERVLGTLRYQPRPLKIPAATPVVPRRNFTPLVALAATIALLVVGAGIWASLNVRNNRADVEHLSSRPPADTTPDSQKSNTAVVPSPPIENERATSGQQPLPVQRPRRVRRDKKFLALDNSKQNRNARGDVLTRRQRKEAVQAKEQLLMALRLASNKLNLAQKRAQGIPGSIRNQHKVG